MLKHYYITAHPTTLPDSPKLDGDKYGQCGFDAKQLHMKKEYDFVIRLAKTGKCYGVGCWRIWETTYGKPKLVEEIINNPEPMLF